MNISRTCDNNFGARLSPNFRKMVGEYRAHLRANKRFDDVLSLQKIMVKIKFICPGEEITDDFKLNAKIPLVSTENKKKTYDINILQEVLDNLAKIKKQ